VFSRPGYKINTGVTTADLLFEIIVHPRSSRSKRHKLKVDDVPAVWRAGIPLPRRDGPRLIVAMCVDASH
jgi:hypothetical protein